MVVNFLLLFVKDILSWFMRGVTFLMIWIAFQGKTAPPREAAMCFVAGMMWELCEDK